MRHETAEEHWTYNAEDCIRTFEIATAERSIIASLQLDSVEAFQQRLFWPVLHAMQRGVRIDLSLRESMGKELEQALAAREQYFKDVLGHPFNPRSNKQMQELFYDDLKLSVLRNRKTGNPTLNDEALEKLALREPIIKPILDRISEFRSIGVFLGTFVQAPLDFDNRMRCSYNICGTETYRFSSSENAFGSGTNLQNLPKGTKPKEEGGLTLPNVRNMFVPDPGMTFFDMDLDRADLQVVVWEADDLELKQMLREGLDIHTENAKTLNITRQLAKSCVHGTNYGGGPRTMAMTCGITVRQAELMQARWFAAHPGIKKWHTRTMEALRATHSVTNKFGYRRFYFDRIDGILPEALAWIPQSTVACYINRIWVALFENLKECEVLLQVHDSLAGQFPTSRTAEIQSRVKELSQIIIPYDDPLIISTGMKTSTTSWGDCE